MAGILTNLQTATLATFMDLSSIGGLAVINYGAAIAKTLILPLADGGMVGTIVAASADGAHDLVKWYFLKTSAGMPVAGGTTTAG